MAMLAVDLPFDGAREGKHVRAEAGPKLSKDEYLALRRSFNTSQTFGAEGQLA